MSLRVCVSVGDRMVGAATALTRGGTRDCAARPRAAFNRLASPPDSHASMNRKVGIGGSGNGVTGTKRGGSRPPDRPGRPIGPATRAGRGMSDHYPDHLIALLEAVWGEGFMSPGGPAEVGRVIGGNEIRGAKVLDIGCGAGGGPITLAEAQGVAYVTGIDVEDAVLERARALVAARGLTDRIGLVKVAPGPLPFPGETFDLVFSKDSIVHIRDKHALMAEVIRVLKPGGWFLASDWLIGSDSPSPAMQAAGFTAIETRSRNEWYRREARDELARLRGVVGRVLAEKVGEAFVQQNIGVWERMIPVLDSGEHCPTHLAGQKP